jgi:tetratricopeptide (TPR) repeat protein
LASRNTLYKYLSLAGLSLLLVTCSVEKNTNASRFYQSLTARFNIYFNGLESYKAGLAKIYAGYQDDFAEILNVYESSDPSTSKYGSADMERAIQKASKLISLKSITAKPEIKNKRDISEKDKKLLDQKEYNEWVDDSYLLIGKAHFYKHEYTEADDVFTYCITEANDPMIRTEASIWLARVFNETGDYAESYRILSEQDVASEHTKEMKSMHYTALADLFVKQKRYADAIDPLNKALEYISGKRNRYRLTYLLAQLYEQTGNSAEATVNYRKVIHMNPPYDVEFNARINVAGVFDINSGDPREIKKELEKMLRDSKNKEFHDQIYFALGNLEMKEGNDSQSLDYFRKSAATSMQNRNQKGKSYLSLADYYYNKSDYKRAGMYYDSAVYFIDQNHPSYLALKTKSFNLNQLISQLVVIEREDSLQRVALMPETQRNDLISTIISRLATQENRGTGSEYTDRYNIGQYYENERRFQGNIEQEGKWYFYNQAALTFGRTEFRRRWGDRKLEDNWRRSNRTKTSTGQFSNDQENAVKKNTSDTIAAVMDNKNPAFYLKNLPLTDSLLKISNETIATALLNAGAAYADKISDTLKAAETYESLLSRYPESPLIPEALYNLYNLTRIKNSTKAEVYRQRLIQKFPESEFAKILSDPGYYSKKLDEQKLTGVLYERAYNAYNEEKFTEAIAIINEALQKYPADELAPKFMLLHAYSIARISDERTLKEDLNILIDTWPKAPESEKAKELISYLNKKVPELKIEEDKAIAKEIYVADTTSTHVFALIINNPSFNLNQATFDVISYNIDNYTNKNYRTEGTLVENKFIMITVSGFRSFREAIDYYKAFDREKLIRNVQGSESMSFIINRENLESLLKDKSPERYDVFFRENLLK